LKLAKQHISVLLLHHGLSSPDAKWTVKHSAWLHRQHFGQAGTQFFCQVAAELVELLALHLKRLDQQIMEITPRAIMRRRSML
jgi:hypothetical protein